MDNFKVNYIKRTGVSRLFLVCKQVKGNAHFDSAVHTLAGLAGILHYEGKLLMNSQELNYFRKVSKN